MPAISSRDASWYNATTLQERSAFFKELPTGKLKSSAPHEDVNVEAAKKKESKWTSFSPFSDPEVFEQRLRADQLTLSDFRALLAQPPESLASRSGKVPKWLESLISALEDSLAAPEPIEVDETSSQGFLYLVEPLVREAQARVAAAVDDLIESKGDLTVDRESFLRSLSTGLYPQVIKVMARTLTLELHVARLEGKLDGDTPEERFRSFVRRLRQRDVALSILREYPVLARLARTVLQNWTRFTCELVEHLSEDWADIREQLFAEEEIGDLEGILSGAGDTHRQGRSVAILRFRSGHHLVYKPRSLAVEQHFQGLLAWLNERGFEPGFRTLRVIERGDHGWVEFVEAGGCDSAEQVGRFYQRLGGLLALFYAMEATDFHFENVVASGEHPVPVDLESLFHPRIHKGVDPQYETRGAQREMAYSVLRVGLLPQRIWAIDGSDGVDLSAVSGGVHQLTPTPVATWEGSGTDDLRLVRRRVEIPEGKNRVRLGAELCDPAQHAEDIQDGFESVYRLLLDNRRELLAPRGPIDAFADDPVRVILRATRVYSNLLFESYHPDVLRDALDRDILLDRLWVGGEDRPDLVPVIQAETRDIRDGDVPYFLTRPGSRDLWTSRHERLDSFVDKCGMDVVRERIERLSEADLERQSWFVEASLASLSMGEEQANDGGYVAHAAEAPATAERLLAKAVQVGERLAELGLEDEADPSERSVSWLGLSLIHNRLWQLLPLGQDLYNGLPGVALFLAHLGAVSGEERFTELASLTVTNIRSSLEELREHLKGVGGFSGWGGLVYTLSHLGSLWNDSSLLEDAKAILPLLPPLIEDDDELDIITGCAGCAGGLLALHRVAPDSGALSVAVQCGDHLLEKAEVQETGLGWNSKIEAPRPLLGFSHGASGMAWALLELAACTGDERFRNAAVEALRYERSHFDPERGNWPDFRALGTPPGRGRTRDDSSRREDEGVPDEPAAEPRFMTAWCHGAPGVGLARLHALKHLDEPELNRDLERAVETTLTSGLGHNHSLCHGDLGNLDFLATAARDLQDPELEDRVSRQAGRVLESIERHGWRTGIPRGVESPGLMTGLAGIGYGLLRLTAPERVPSILLLEPPLPTLCSSPCRASGGTAVLNQHSNGKETS